MSGFISVLVNNYVPSNIYTVTCLLALFQVIVLIFHRGVEAQTYKHTLPLMHRNCTQTHMNAHTRTHTHTYRLILAKNNAFLLMHDSNHQTALKITFQKF